MGTFDTSTLSPDDQSAYQAWQQQLQNYIQQHKGAVPAEVSYALAHPDYLKQHPELQNDYNIVSGAGLSDSIKSSTKDYHPNWSNGDVGMEKNSTLWSHPETWIQLALGGAMGGISAAGALGSAADVGSSLGGGSFLAPTQIATGAGSLSGAGIGTGGLVGAGEAAGIGTGAAGAGAGATGLGSSMEMPGSLATSGGPITGGTDIGANGMDTSIFSPQGPGMGDVGPLQNSGGGPGSVMDKILGKNGQNMSDLSKIIGAYGQTDATNRGVKGNFLQKYDALKMANARANQEQESDAIRKLGITSYLASGGAKPLHTSTPAGNIPDFGFAQPASADQMQGASTLRNTLLKRLTPEGAIPLTDPNTYVNPGTGENIANIASLGTGAIGALGGVKNTIDTGKSIWDGVKDIGSWIGKIF